MIGKESRRLTQLINNILDFSRIEAGRKEYRLVPSDLGAVVRDVVESYRFAIEKQGFTLELELADDLPPLALDPEALSQALINLLNNAIKYSPEHKAITVGRARASSDRVLLSVSDRGIGDPARRAPPHLREVLPRRDQPGAQHQGQRAGSVAGPAHHRGPRGRVELRSTPGEGSTFTLVLPVPPEPRALGASPSQPGVRWRPARSKSSHEQDPDRRRRAGHGRSD